MGLALGWFRDLFLRCHDRAALVKTWLPAQYTGPGTWVDELVYNRALTLVCCLFLFPWSTLKLYDPNVKSRTAARKELLDQHKSPDECERLYEESLWCLYALQDDLLQKGNPFVDEDRETIATCACTSFSYIVLRWLTSDVVLRDQTDKAASRALPRAYGDADARAAA